MQISMTWPQYLRGECTLDGRKIQVGFKPTYFKYRSDRGSERLMVPRPASHVSTLLILLMRRGHPVPISDIISFLWNDPDQEPEYADDQVRKDIVKLRRKGFPISLVLDRKTETAYRLEW
jgi:hypothetical protein